MSIFKKRFKGIDGLYARPEEAIEAGVIKHLLGQGSSYRGDSAFKSGVKVHGVYEGSLSVENGVVWITAQGRVKGSVTATQIYIDGVLDGEAKAQVVVVAGTGTCFGRVISDTFIARNPTVMDLKAKVYSQQMARKMSELGAGAEGNLVIIQGENRKNIAA